MSTDATDHRELDQFEQQVLADLKPEADDSVLDEVQDEPEARPAPTPAPTEPAAAKPDARPEAEKGDVRAALRMSRRSDRLANERADRLERDLQALRSANPQDPDADLDEAATAMQRLEVDVPQAAVVLKQMAKQIEGLQTQSAAKVIEHEPEFVPQTLPAELQDAVDDVPELLGWQTTQVDADKWAMAKATDGLLFAHPAWKDKPATQRMAEVVRRVNQELGRSPAPPPPPARGTAAIDNARERGIETLSDLRGGGTPAASQGQDFRSMKSDADILNALNRGQH